MTENLLANAGPQIDPNKDYFADLVGEGKKYSDQKAAGRAIMEKDMFIEKLKQEQADLRADFLSLQDEYKTTASLKELVDQLKTPEHITPVNTEKREDQFDPSKLDSLLETKFDSKLQAYETKKSGDANFNLVQSKLVERYGNDFSNAVKTQIDSLGISEARLNEMARNEPKVLMKALGLDQPVRNEPFDAPVRSSTRNDSFAPSVGTKRNFAAYEAMRKDPKTRTVYWDPKTQVQMHKDAQAMGEAFYT